MGRQYLLAYDLGTTGNKAILVDDHCKIVASAFCPYPTFFPFAKAVEQDPWDWWKSVRETTEDIMAAAAISARDIAGIAFSGQMMGCVPVTNHADPIGHAIIWADMRGTDQAARLNRLLGPATIYQVVGNRANASYSAAKMMWIHDRQPERFRQTHKFLQPKDFIAARMTGRFVTDFSDAGGTNLFDVQRLEWSDQMIRAAGLHRGILPDAMSSVETIGPLLPDAATELGLVGGIPVVIGGGDGACAAAGAGVISENATYQYLGSSSWLGTAASRPLLDERMRIFNWAHVVPGLYAPTGTMQAAGGALQWLRNILRLKSSGGRSAYQVMDAMADSSPLAADGLMFLPYLLGERSPIWNENARGSFIGLTMKHQTGDLVRAVMEGVALNMKGILDAFSEQVTLERIQFIGGGAKSRLWAQILADVYGYPLRVPKVLDEATALGAAVTGGVGVGLFDRFEVINQVTETDFILSPNPDNHRVYERLQPVYEAAYQALKGTFGELIKFA